MEWRIFLEIYFGFNLFLAGYVFTDYQYENKRYWFTLIALLTGVVFPIYIFIWLLLKKIDDEVSFKFWITLIFTNTYDKIDGDLLVRANDDVPNRNWIFRQGIRILNKIHNYSPPQSKP